MCTVSWLHDTGGYHLLCNRDEKRTRRPAAPPAARASNGVLFIAPVDGDHGGAWISANEFGLSLCLLNGTPAGQARRSRGLLLLDLAGARTAGEVCGHLWLADLSPVAPFTLVALEPGHPAAVFEWDGIHRAVIPNGDQRMPLVSSSFDPAGVRAHRQKHFERLLRSPGSLTPGRLYAFHESHEPQAGPYSPCMHRPDAETVSFSWIQVKGGAAEFFYSPAAPCQWRAGQTTRIKLRL